MNGNERLDFEAAIGHEAESPFKADHNLLQTLTSRERRVIGEHSYSDEINTIEGVGVPDLDVSLWLSTAQLIAALERPLCDPIADVRGN